MKIFRSLPKGPAAGLAFLLVLGGGCASPTFSPEAAFTRPLKDFARIEPRVLALEFTQKDEQAECGARAAAFSKDYREALLYRLHRKRILDRMDGPLLLLEGRVLKYEWTVTPGTPESPEMTRGTIEVAFLFKDEAGGRIGAGTVTANESGHGARAVMDMAEKHVVYSLYKFLRKEISRVVESEPLEPQVAP